MYYLSCSRLLWFVNWSPSQVVLPFPWKGFLGPLNLFDQDDGLWSHLKLSSEIKSQMRWKSKDATFLPFDRDRSRHSHFIMKPADNGEDDKYFSIWSKRGLCWIKTGVFWHVVRRPSSTLLPIVFNTLLALSQWSHFEGKLFGGFFKAYIFVFLTLNLLSSLWVICLCHAWPMIMVGNA